MPLKAMTTNKYESLSDTEMILRCGNTIVLFDKEDFPLVSERQWSINRQDYVSSGAGKEQVLMHRLVMQADKGDVVDHINRVKVDNRKCNLRFCTTSQNTLNRCVQSNNKLGIKGVVKVPNGKYQVQLKCEGKTVYLGLYDSLDEAEVVSMYGQKYLAGDFASEDCQDIELPDYVVEKLCLMKRYHKMSKEIRDEIKNLHDKGLSNLEISKKVNFSISSIARFLNGETYSRKEQ